MEFRQNVGLEKQISQSLTLGSAYKNHVGGIFTKSGVLSVCGRGYSDTKELA